MRTFRLFTVLIVAFSVLGTPLVIPAARAAADSTLATVPIRKEEGRCDLNAPTFDDVVAATSTMLRMLVPTNQLAAFDGRVGEVRAALATVRVHRDGLPVDPRNVNERTAFLDDPVVTYVVNGLDAVRTGRIDTTMSVSQLTVNEAIEVFILAARIVKIPTQLMAGLVPTGGFLLRAAVSATFFGVKALARQVQNHLAASCAVPTVYPELRSVTRGTEHLDLPAPLITLADSVMPADGVCTPVAELTTRAVVERTRAVLDSADLPLDRSALSAAAGTLQQFLDEHRIAKVALLRRTEELGPMVDAFDYAPITFLANLGFDIHEGKALDTVALSEIKVENILDLITLPLETASLLMRATTTAADWYFELGEAVLMPLTTVQTLDFAPSVYGAPILKGVMQSMCAV
ncbi:hypothetical protein ACFYO1_26510 [Nocardia sp. NPDC006044]|uniref:hypothetical protein n=1 Tax=Nocardia sp. NPDC006044 TaxID=3364306 RepID=UPI00369F6A5B